MKQESNIPPVGACIDLGQEEPWLDAMMRGGIDAK